MTRLERAHHIICAQPQYYQTSCRDVQQETARYTMLTLHQRSLLWPRALLRLDSHAAGQLDARHHLRACISKKVRVAGHLACRPLLCNTRCNRIWLQQTTSYLTARPLARNSLRQVGQRAGIVNKSPPSCIQHE